MTNPFWTIKQFVISLALTAVWCIFLHQFGSPFYTLEYKWQDHLSNISMTQVFLKHGIRVYSEPKSELAQPWEPSKPIPAHYGQFFPANESFYSLDGKPLFFVWPEISNPYPIGNYVYYFPFSYVAYNLDLGFRTAAAAFVFVTLFLAHLSFFLFLNFLKNLHSDLNTRWRKFFFYLVLFLLYCELCRWPMNGQYETVALLPILISLYMASRREWTTGVLCLGVAMFFHPRALIFLPFAFLWFYQWIKSKEKSWLQDLLKLSLAALGAFVLAQALWLSLSDHNSTAVFRQLNDWGIQELTAKPSLLFILLSAVVLLSAWLIQKRLWLTLMMFLWPLILFIQSAQIRSWYVTLMLPILVIGLLEPNSQSENSQAKKSWTIFVFNCLTYFILVQFYPGNSPLDFQFVKDVASSFVDPGLMGN